MKATPTWWQWPEDTEEIKDNDTCRRRLLAGYDTLLMSHADKTWTVPNSAENKAIWRASAVVAPVVLAGGRAVAVWSQKKSKSGRNQIEPLAGWEKEFLPQLEEDAQTSPATRSSPQAEMVVV